MKLICALSNYKFKGTKDALDVVLYGRTDRPTRGSAGGAIKEKIAESRLHPAARAWDFLSLALAVNTADLAGHRTESPDGWTREFELEVAVDDPAFWNGQQQTVRRLLGFLTTDLWNVNFIGGGFSPKPPAKNVRVLPPEDCVSLLSGGLDSFIGNLDLVTTGKRPFAVSQTVVGDAENQRAFAKIMGNGLRHLQMNHNGKVPNQEAPPSQRARSLIFMAYGVLAATTLKQYHADATVTLYVCENGFISINPPLTDLRLGSLSTRTTHPVFLGLLRQLLEAAGLRVRIENPYQLKTKGEMLKECADKKLLRAHASQTTSCGRYLIHKHTHCGRCVPCLVRRAAFLAAGMTDTTKYVYGDLGRDDDAHAGFDDVRSVAMALAEVEADGLERWLGTALSTTLLGNVAPLQAMVSRSLDELSGLLKSYGVK
jgi:7-cyano-7-deazaguanine synthase in queuosine biosynthesis